MENKLLSTKKIKAFKSQFYNYHFDKETGFFARWGESMEEDPSYSPFGPEILDIEITKGTCKGNCSFCYKCNGNDQEVYNMTFEEFKNIFDKMPIILTQIAFGITDIYANPDFFKMMEYARENGVIPNYTAHGLDFDDYAIQKTVELCGVVCISVVNKEKTFESIRRLYKAGMKLINIHYVLAEETYDEAIELIDEIKDSDLAEMINAIVFLDYKPKGANPDHMHHLTKIEKFVNLINILEESELNFGFDSCSGPLFYKSFENKEARDMIELFAEPCESGIFSSYINCTGDFYPCSFSEGEGEWKTGVSVLEANDFLNDVWEHKRTKEWRENLLNSSRNCKCYFSKICRSCTVFDSINICKNEN